MNELEKQIELVATDLVMVSEDDAAGLAALHERILELIKIIGDESETLAQIAQKCADFLERIILKDVDDLAAAMKVINDTISAMQQVIRDKRDISEVNIPGELEMYLNKGEDAEKPQHGKEAEKPESLTKQQEIKEGSLHDDQESFILNLESADQPLIAEFITEAREHCTTAEQLLMDLETGDDPDSAINAIFRSFHTIKGAAGFLDLNPVLVLAHECETLLDMARKGSITISGMIADTVFDTIDALRALFDGIEQALETTGSTDVTDIISELLVKLRRIISNKGQAESIEPAEEDLEIPVSGEAPKRLGEILIASGELSPEDIIDELGLQKEKELEERLGQMLVKNRTVPAKKVAQALRVQARSWKEKVVVSSGLTVKEMVKIDTERLDGLLDTIGELVIAESMVGQDEEILGLKSPHIGRNLSHLNKITRELQEMGMAMRLVPIKPTFQKLARAVRDLTKKAGKKINLEISGEDTEVDRSIVEKIGDPLMHMVRNSVDHGIESPKDRIKAGKPETGTIKLSAYHKSGNIYFDIEDDGNGLDKERILAKAKEKGLVDSNKELTDKEIFNLIILPGFSTARKITDISGRGVGMDVVKRNIEAMRGYLDIESPPDKGSKFSMKLPLTLAIIDGMLISVGEEKLIVPTLSVVESVRLSPDMIFTVTDKAEMINLRGNLLPLIRINRLLGLPDRENEGGNRTVVVVEEAVSRAGLVIDELLGQRQVVIKSLGPVFEHQKWVSGGAILSDGRIGLIIDVIGIIKLAQTVEVPVASAFQDAASEFKAEMDAYKEERIGSEEKNHGDEGSPKLPTTVGQRDKETGKEYYEEAEIEKREAVVTG